MHAREARSSFVTGRYCGAGGVESGQAPKVGEVFESEQFDNPVHGQDEGKT